MRVVPWALLVALLASAAGAGAQTLYVDDDAPRSCACKAPAHNDDAGCGQSDRPFACIRDALNSGLPFDTLLVRDGTYHEGIMLMQGGSSDRRRTIKAEHVHGALIDCPAKE